MKKAMLGALVGVVLVLTALFVGLPEEAVFAQRVAPEPLRAEQGGLIPLLGPSDESGQLLAVVDPRLRTIGVYHIEAGSGKIALRSVRQIRWDLQMTHLNTDAPLPEEIRLLLEQRHDR